MKSEKALKFLLLMCAFAFSIKALREPDFWWMLRTGEWIVEHGSVMSADVFSYTLQGSEWINVKWLYEVIIYAFASIGGPESIPVLAGLFYALILFILWQTAPLLRQNGMVGLFIATIVFLIGSEFRMTGRPEMSSHLLTALFLWLIHRHNKKPDAFIFALLPLQILWANLHEGYGTGMVIAVGWFLMTLVQALAGRAIDWKKPGLITLGVLLAPAVSPQSFTMILHPLNIFTQLGDNQFTTELFSAATAYFWQQKEAYLLLIVLAVFGFRLLSVAKGGLKSLLSHDDAQFLGFTALFLVLGLTAHRNIPFTLIAAFPLICSTLSDLSMRGKIMEARWPMPAMIGLAALLYVGIVSNQYYSVTGSKNRFGLYVLPDKHPIPAAEALANNAVNGPVFADYLTSSYLLWQLRPDFKTFIDLRDLDIFDREFFKQYALITKFPEAFEQSDSIYHYGAVTLYQPALDELHAYLYKHPDWTLVSANPVAITYLRGAPSESRFEGFPTTQPSTFANALNHVLNPLFEIKEPEKDVDFIAASYYMRVGNRSLAAQHLQTSLERDAENYDAWLLYGRIYATAMDNAQDNEQAKALFTTAQNAFYSAFKQDDEDPRAYAELSQLLVNAGKYAEAYKITSRGLEISPDNSVLLKVQENALYVLAAKTPSLAQAYLETLTKVVDQNLGNKPLRFRLSIMLCEGNRCDEAAPYLTDLVIPDLPPAEQQRLEACKRKCL